MTSIQKVSLQNTAKDNNMKFLCPKDGELYDDFCMDYLCDCNDGGKCTFVRKHCQQLLQNNECQIWDNECGEIQCPLEPPKKTCCAFCELLNRCCDSCPYLEEMVTEEILEGKKEGEKT